MHPNTKSIGEKRELIPMRRQKQLRDGDSTWKITENCIIANKTNKDQKV